MTSILASKLYLPRLRPNVVSRPHLIERLSAGLYRKLTLISAPAGFGKTTLVSEWINGSGQAAAWLSLDEGDNDPIRSLTYLVGALQTISPSVGEGILRALQSSQPPPPNAILAALLNEMTTIPSQFILVLDDYHVIETRAVDQILSTLIQYLPPQMHLVIVTREDPQLPLARLRAQGQLTEMRAVDLRFTPAEATEFLTQVMGLTLSGQDVAALERRTEGWIAGLQLAAISLQGHDDAAGFIQSFTGSHQYVLDFLMEEVLHQQPEHIQTFMLCTSILDRLCGPLCDAVLLSPAGSGQATLEFLDRANLFLVPLDHERRWYRYHHLFADLLRLQLQQGIVASSGDGEHQVHELHLRASTWYECQSLEIEAFHHAVAVNDVERATRLIEGNGIPLHLRGALYPVLNWLETLPKEILDAHPSLWVMYASALSMTGQMTTIEQKLQAAETALQDADPDNKRNIIIGSIAAVRALNATPQSPPDTVIAQARCALEYLHPNNMPVRTALIWKLGWAYQIQGDRVAAGHAYAEAISLSQISQNTIIDILASIGLGTIQEAETHLGLAFQTYRHAVQLIEDPLLPVACMVDDAPLPGAYEAHLGLARLLYEWNDLEEAQQHGQHGVQLATQANDTNGVIASNILLARLYLAQGDVAGAAALLAEASRSSHQHNIVHRLPEIAAVQVLVLLRQDYLVAAAHLAQAHDLPLSQARVHLAQRDSATALTVLATWRPQVEARRWLDEQLKVLMLQALALDAQGDGDQAIHLISEVLAMAEPEGFIRLFLDEGPAMRHLVSQAATLGSAPDYIGRLLVAWKTDTQQHKHESAAPSGQPLIEPLSPRELEVLRLIAQGLSNQEISERLFLVVGTVKGHTHKIFGKLGVQRRTEAIARARELGLI
jgi:LuxR family transcriptional regulator, maltose regulon positive regulatory protein